MELRAGDAVVEVAPEAGGRIAQVTVGGRRCLYDDRDAGPLFWGSFPMVPWAGRIRGGTFDWEGTPVELEQILPPWAIHGTGFVTPWEVTALTSTAVELGCPLDWALGGSASQRISVAADRLRCELSVTAGTRSMPVSVGWHPWFLRPARADVAFTAMYERGSDSLPTGRLVPVPDGPWDDCFAFATQHPRVVLDRLTLTIASDCTHWVLYDQRGHALCVEPQSAPPNAVNLGVADVLGPGQTFSRWMTWQWDASDVG